MNDFDWIDTQSELEALVDELCESEAYALDTEFHRERTYLPVLALIQIATPDRISLVDPFAIDVRPLKRALEHDNVCVMHAAAQDLEILDLACGATPRRLFDTQIAALFCGYRTSSLGKLVEGFLDLQLDKSAQLTDWTRRPLPDADLSYAASDVAHLLELRDALSRELRSRGRGDRTTADQGSDSPRPANALVEASWQSQAERQSTRGRPGGRGVARRRGKKK
jgi:ribonuclease D